jgi:hypothetical protein
MTQAAGPLSGRPRRGKRPGRYEAWGLLALLAPHVALGAWLLIVPDHVAFTAAQWIVLVHVLLGLIGTPIAVIWAYRHIVEARPRTPKTQAVVTVRWLLTIGIAVAFLSGLIVIGRSQGMPMAQAHAVAGVVLAVVLVLHLILERRRGAASGVVAAIAVSVVVMLLARDRIEGDTPAPSSPEFAFDVREVGLYDEAAWCGSCHVENYEEWRLSTHGRSTDIQDLHRELEEKPELQTVDLEMVGHAIDGAAGAAGSPQVPPVPMQCPMCHAPLTFYTDDRVPLLETEGIAHEGISCSFCHTLRGIKEIPPGANQKAREFIRGIQQGELTFEDIDLGEQFQMTPFYISAPETVRRYFGQGSSNPLARWIGDYLITWRPEVHRRDYHSPFIDGSRMCQGCHGAATDAHEAPDKTYPDWEASDYNASDPKDRVECHDCHMVAEVTARPVKEPGRLVPWGPVRAQRRSHLFLGGNAAASLRFDSPETAEKQRELGRRTLQLTIEDTAIEGGRLRARVALENEGVGHYFPAYESLFRFAFIRLVALDAAGNVIVQSPRPDTAHADVPGTPILYRWVNEQKMTILKDTTIAPHEKRSFEAWVDLPAEAPAVARVEARLGHNFDPEEFLVAGRPLHASVGVLRPQVTADSDDVASRGGSAHGASAPPS